MITKLFTHLKDEAEKRLFQRLAIDSKPVLSRIRELLQEEIDSIDELMIQRSVYDSSDWPFYHSSLLGEKRSYKKLIKYLESIIND